MDRVKFWSCHISGLDNESMTGLCPSCRNWGFQILWKDDGDEFICLRCDLKGKGIESFIEQIDGYRFPELRKLVREMENKKILEAQAYECGEEEISSDEISFRATDIENRRTHVWWALAEMVTEETFDGDGRIPGISSMDELIGMVAERVRQDGEEIRGHLKSLIQFNDIKIDEDAVIVRWLHRHSF